MNKSHTLWKLGCHGEENNDGLPLKIFFLNLFFLNHENTTYLGNIWKMQNITKKKRRVTIQSLEGKAKQSKCP